MPVRTTCLAVRFSSELLLYGFDGPQSAGEYQIEYDEEEIEGISFRAYRRVATFIHLPAITAGAQTRQMVPIDAAELEEALAKDREAA
ncbi:MAG: hypothetical protein ABWY13_00255 [Mesorhizobium sp.]|jgi:hypothetical protein